MDLVRTILLAVEGGQRELNASRGLAGSDASPDALEYHYRLLRQAGLIDVLATSLASTLHLHGLTWEGHDFLETIRDPEVWKRTKEGASKVGGWSFEFLKDMAIAYGKQVAKERLGLEL